MNVLQLNISWLILFFTLKFMSLTGQDSIGVYAMKDLKVVQSFYDNGKIKREAFYFFGIKVAARKWKYLEDTYEAIEYPEYKKPSHRIKKVYYYNGKLKSRATIIKGNIHGLYETWYITGVPHCQCNYNHGNQDGLQVIHHVNGQVRHSSVYNNGRIWSVVSDYKFNGTKLDSGTLQDGTGYVNVYDRNGILVSVYYYFQGKFLQMENKLTGETFLHKSKSGNYFQEDYLKI